jgi:hypothetical protein
VVARLARRRKKPPANDSTNVNTGDKDAVATTPVEESKGKPKVAE